MLGGSGYVRDREHEFAARNIPRAELLAEVDRTRKVLVKAFASLGEERLQEPFPIPIQGEELNTAYFLLHLEGHLNYHLGQVNYLRRML